MTFRLDKVYEAYRRIFCTCKCGSIFRLSESQIQERNSTEPNDWLSEVNQRLTRLDRKLEFQKEKFRSQSVLIREKQRKVAEARTGAIVRSILPQLREQRINTRDVKTIFRPVSFVVFHGLNERSVQKVSFMDSFPKSKSQETTQKQIQAVIQKGNYSWSTVRVNGEGKVSRQ